MVTAFAAATAQSMPDWRNPADYAFTEQLQPAQWAWEFLRRNPDYRRDFNWFSRTWAALEADYGRPPERDFARWKRDPRAYRGAAAECSDEAGACASEDGEQLLIECWMGNTWGFYKFPLHPDYDMPRPGEELVWREAPDTTLLVGADNDEYLGQVPWKLALGFDLSRTLKDQFEEAKRFLVVMQRRLRQQGELEPATIAGCRGRWTLCLRALDGESQGIREDDLAIALTGGNTQSMQQLLEEAYRLREGGYRHIPSMAME
jgi:hypothetical protein